MDPYRDDTALLPSHPVAPLLIGLGGPLILILPGQAGNGTLFGMTLDFGMLLVGLIVIGAIAAAVATGTLSGLLGVVGGTWIALLGYVIWYGQTHAVDAWEVDVARYFVALGVPLTVGSGFLVGRGVLWVARSLRERSAR